MLFRSVSQSRYITRSPLATVVGFFEKRGFGKQAAENTAVAVLTHAKRENVSPFEIVDKLKGLTEIQLSHVVLEIMNSIGGKSAVMGYSVPQPVNKSYEARNIIV